MTEQKIFSKYPLPTNEFTPEFQRELSRAKESSLSQIKDAMTTSSTKKPKESGAKNEKPSTDSNASLLISAIDANGNRIETLTMRKAESGNYYTIKFSGKPSAVTIISSFTTTPRLDMTWGL